VIEQNLRARHGGLIWRRLEKTDVTQIINVQAEFDAAILCNSEANRTVTKYALNLLAHHYGLAFVMEKFTALKAFVVGKGVDQRVGIFWNPPLLRSLPFAPPKHLFIIYADGAAHRVTVFLWLFSLFPYAVVIEEPAVAVDVFWNAAIDPHDGKFTPLFVGAVPVEPAARIGAAAARHAMRFIERIFRTSTVSICRSVLPAIG
jgi:hypothetical protein